MALVTIPLYELSIYASRSKSHPAHLVCFVSPRLQIVPGDDYCAGRTEITEYDVMNDKCDFAVAYFAAVTKYIGLRKKP